ncbi:Bax inhibitor-1 family protein [uncultured Nonlabens sp.]|uniref:Bax inhibitor-1/YccA family protein n=1 Tax=uncultured Nonlabens sp. TaxID=859306 RepID=UPI002602D445|nr:Bax inhibitor-1 family protein [uncultured Nonlabens sp.]
MNQDHTPHYDTSIQPLSIVNDEARAIFYKKTYGHVAIATLLFVIIEAILLRIEPLVNFMFSLTQGWTWLLVLGAFMMATSYAEKMAHKSHDRRQQYLGLFLFVVAEAVIFLPLIAMALQYQAALQGGESNLLSQAAILTLALFTALSAVVLITKKDFSFLKSILSVGFIIAIGLIIAGMIFGFDLGLFFSGAMVLLAAGSILYQTSNLVHKYHTDQYVGAALGLFSSLMLLFWYILRIFMSRD